jgi:hypothetical protein
MEVKNIDIRKAIVTEYSGNFSIDVEIIKTIKDGETTLCIENKEYNNFLLIELSNFTENVSFDFFVEKVKEGIKEFGVDSDKVFIFLVNSLTIFDKCKWIRIELNDISKTEINIHNIINHYRLFDISFNNSTIVGTGNTIRYSEISFTLYFDRAGKIKKFTQPNMREKKPITTYKNEIEQIKKLIFNQTLYLTN